MGYFPSSGYPRQCASRRATSRSARGALSAARRTRSRAPSRALADPPSPGPDVAGASVRGRFETVWRSFAIVEVETSRRSAIRRCVNPCSRRTRAWAARSAGFRRPVRGRLGTAGRLTIASAGARDAGLAAQHQRSALAAPGRAGPASIMRSIFPHLSLTTRVGNRCVVALETALHQRDSPARLESCGPVPTKRGPASPFGQTRHARTPSGASLGPAPE